MHALGFEALFTIAVPGSILFASAYLVLARFFGQSRLISLIAGCKDNEWIFGSGVLIVSIVLGGLLATLTGFIESHVLDPITRKSLPLTEEQYDAEWLAYVDSLEGESNPYIGRLVMFMLFETRLSLAIFALFVGWGVWHHTIWGWMASALLFGTACLLMRSGWQVHKELAEYRHRNFSSQAMPTDKGN